MLARAGQCVLPVLLGGETGTGKTTSAEAIHRASGRPGPFIVARALPESLIEAELFGHEKGAFTGAARLKTGLLEQADRGTLLIEEVGDLSPKAQVALLGVLEDGRFRRLGSERDITVDVRVVAATWKDLAALVSEGAFREDLYYRLNVLRIEMPALRERGDDVALLAESQLARELEADERAALLEHDWPGNIRELRNVTDRMGIGMPVDEALGVAPAAVGDDMSPGHIVPRDDMSPAPRWLSRLVSAVRVRGLREVAHVTGWNYETLKKRVSGRRGMTPAQLNTLAAAVGLEIHISGPH